MYFTFSLQCGKGSQNVENKTLTYYCITSYKTYTFPDLRKTAISPTAMINEIIIIRYEVPEKSAKGNLTFIP